MSSPEVSEGKTELQHGAQHSEVEPQRPGSDGHSNGHELDKEVEVEEVERHGSHVYDLDEKAKVADYKAGAIEAENAEHNMTVLEAVRAYPAASFWAFVMSFTIVSCLFSSLLSFPRTSNRS